MEQDLVIDNDRVVSMHYVLRNNDGEILDQSGEDNPLTYLHGRGQIISGLATELDGLTAGDEKSVTVAPAEAYGELDPEAQQLVPANVFPDEMEIAPGVQVQLQDQSGNVFQARIVEEQAENVLLDFNHPLAGETLHFDVRIEEVRPATEEELEHGHAH